MFLGLRGDWSPWLPYAGLWDLEGQPLMRLNYRTKVDSAHISIQWQLYNFTETDLLDCSLAAREYASDAEPSRRLPATHIGVGYRSTIRAGRFSLSSIEVIRGAQLHSVEIAEPYLTFRLEENGEQHDWKRLRATTIHLY